MDDIIKDYLLKGFSGDIISKNFAKLSRSTIYRRIKLERYNITKNFVINRDDILFSNSNLIKINARVYTFTCRGNYIEFSLNALKRVLLRQRIHALPLFSDDLKFILLKRVNFSKSKLYVSEKGNNIKFSFGSFTDNSFCHKLPDYITLLLDPLEFGICIDSTIEDKDSRQLFNELSKYGWTLFPIRSTSKNRFADMILYSPDKRVFLFEVSRQGMNSKLTGQIKKFIRWRITEKMFVHLYYSRNFNAKYYIILFKGLLGTSVFNDEFLMICKNSGVNFIFTDFNKNWVNEVMSYL